MSERIIVVPTICHTGSYLLVEQILGAFQRRSIKHIATPRPGTVYFDHIYPHNIELLKHAMPAYPSIVPLRHPVLTALSWVKRDRDLGEMCLMWYMLVEQLDRYGPHYLPIDAPDRDTRLAQIGEALGLELRTDWPMTNSKYGTLSGRLEDLPEDARKQTARLCRNISDFLSRFYSDAEGNGRA